VKQSAEFTRRDEREGVDKGSLAYSLNSARIVRTGCDGLTLRSMTDMIDSERGGSMWINWINC